MAASDPEGTPEAREARDAVAFGQEVGRVLSDGTIVGRAEPFAKVFPSSRAVKRRVGVTAWAILEDIALDARIDDHGRLVAETNVRRIADNLGVSKNTVAKHLGVLREHGFTIREEAREGTGEWGGSRYVLDPSACLERFTHTPSRAEDEPSDSGSDEDGADEENDAAEPPEAGSGPCTSSWDTVDPAVSQSTGHRDLGHKQEHAVGGEEQQQIDLDRAEVRELLGRLTSLGVDDDCAGRLVVEHPARQIEDALTVVGNRDADNPAGWLVAAIRRGWDLSDEVDQIEAAARRADQFAVEIQRRRDRRREDKLALGRAADWHAAISTAVSDRQLRRTVRAISDRLPDVAAGSVPVVRAELVRLAAAGCRRNPGRPLAEALEAALEAGAGELPTPLPPPPVEADGEAPPLAERLSMLLDDLSAGCPSERSPMEEIR